MDNERMTPERLAEIQARADQDHQEGCLAALDTERLHLAYYDRVYLLAEVRRLTASLASVTRERDAAVHDLSVAGNCKTCKNNGVLPMPLCADCGTVSEEGKLIDYWCWRGPCADNAPEGAGGQTK